VLFILAESRTFCTFFAPRVSKIQVVAKMHKMHTIQPKYGGNSRHLCTFLLKNSTKKANETGLLIL